MEIKVLGTGCANCKALHTTLQRAIDELCLEATLTKEQDIVKIMEYNVLKLPAVVVQGRVVCSGRVLTLDQAKELLTK